MHAGVSSRQPSQEIREQRRQVELMVDIQQRLLGSPTPELSVLEKIHALLATPANQAVTHASVGQGPKAVTASRARSAAINTSREQKITLLQNRMEHAIGGGMGSRLALTGVNGDDKPRVPKTFTQFAAHLASGQHTEIRGPDNERDMRFDRASSRQPQGPDMR